MASTFRQEVAVDVEEYLEPSLADVLAREPTRADVTRRDAVAATF